MGTSAIQTESTATKAAERLNQHSESSVLAKSREAASASMLADVQSTIKPGSTSNSRPELGQDKAPTGKDHLPPLIVDHNLHKPTTAEFSVPKDAENHVTYKLEMGSVDSYKDKLGNQVNIYLDSKDPNKSFKREEHPDSTWKRTNADGSTIEFNGTETISKDQHKTSVEDSKGYRRTQFEDGKSAEYFPVPDGFTEKHAGPHSQDNFTISQKGDLVVTSKTSKNGDVYENGIDLKDASKNFKQITHPDQTFSKQYANGTAENRDKQGNLTVIDAQRNKAITTANGDVYKENVDGSKSHAFTNPDKSRMEIGTGPKSGDNFSTITYPNGDKLEHKDLGGGLSTDTLSSKDESKRFSKINFPDHSSVITDRDGTLKTTGDGVQSYTTTDGKQLKTDEIDAYKAKDRAVLGQIHNDGSASAKYEKAIRDAVDGLPKDVQKLMVDENLQIKMSDNLGKIWPSEKDKQLRGYPEGATLATIGTGLYEFSFNEIGMAERALSGDPGGIIRHESGHFVDAKAGKVALISDSAAFQTAYDKDVAKLTDVQKGQIAYYLMAKGGRSETFAELSADKFGGRPDQGSYSNRQSLDAYMPETAKLVNKFYDNHLKLDGD